MCRVLGSGFAFSSDSGVNGNCAINRCSFAFNSNSSVNFAFNGGSGISRCSFSISGSFAFNGNSVGCSSFAFSGNSSIRRNGGGVGCNSSSVRGSRSFSSGGSGSFRFNNGCVIGNGNSRNAQRQGNRACQQGVQYCLGKHEILS